VSVASQVGLLATRIGNYLRDSILPRLLPSGGTTGQVLSKTSGTNYAVGWTAVPDPEIWRLLQADTAGVNATGVQPILPGAAAINVEASSTYEYEVLANITRTAGAVSHTTSLAFGGTATITAINVLNSVGNPTGNVLGGASELMQRAAAAVAMTAANTSATEELRIWERGIIVINAAGTLIAQFSYSAAPGQAPSVRRGSFVRLKKLGNNAVVTLN
jgi:hypothetical protein